MKQSQHDENDEPTIATTTGSVLETQYGARIKNVANSKWTLEFGQNCLGKICDSRQFTKEENELIKNKVNQKIKMLETEHHKKFDSADNWSIMIKKETNNERNEIMKRTKTNQINTQMKRSAQYEARSEVLKQREEFEPPQMTKSGELGNQMYLRDAKKED